MQAPTTIQLIEQEPALIAPQLLPPGAGEQLWRRYDAQRGQIRVEFPSPATGQRWRLTALGWVGAVPVSPELQLDIRPKVSLPNIFRMWAYAYGLSDWELLPGVIEVDSLAGFYEFLAGVLARQVLMRTARGLQQAYEPAQRPLIAIRGRLHQPYPPPPPQVGLTCRYQRFTADIPDNQLLAFTLQQIVKGGRCTGDVETAVARAHRRLQAVTTPRTFTSADCINRTYTRLNADYQPLHALCLFFLEQSGPAHRTGDHLMVPFLINMPRLFERFVAAWLQRHLPPPWRLQVQEHVTIGPQQELRFAIDLVLYDGEQQPLMVLDTKYKTDAKPAAADVNQIVTYAKARGCAEAALIYPVGAARPLDVQLDDLRVRRLAFPLDRDPAQGGAQFLAALLSRS